MHWHYLVGLLLVLLCGPVLTYALHKAVTFRHAA
jgi:multisubunit Na+/H+ antiporter MnhG subunit